MNDGLSNNTNNTINKKNILIPVIIVICILCLIGVGVVFIVNNQNKSSVPPVINSNDEQKEFTELESGLMINSLMLLGIEIYDNERYLELPKSGASYYATKGQLREMGYENVDSLVMDNCSDSHAVIFFDVDNLENYPYGYPIITVYDCSGFIVQ